MIKRILALVTMSVLWCMPAHAVPSGCFITDYGTNCYSGSFSPSDCDQFNMSSYSFGRYIYSMCSYVNATESSRALALIDRDKYATLAVVTESSRQEWVAYASKQAALVKKLRKKCGLKCKKVK